MKNGVLVVSVVAVVMMAAGVAVAQVEPKPSGAEAVPGETGPTLEEKDQATLDALVVRYDLDPSEIRIAGEEDPGDEPDPETVWFRNDGVFRIERFERRFAKYEHQKEGWVLPIAWYNIPAEIYREDNQYVWVWMRIESPTKPRSPSDPMTLDGRKLTPKEIASYEARKKEFVLIEPPPSGRKVVFEESSEGLPKSGSWRNVGAFADVDGDGNIDIVAPPQRGGMASLRPEVFLGDGKGGWKRRRFEWPKGLNYGGVAVADFNKDGHADMAFAVHLGAPAIFLADGKGGYVDASEGLPERFPSRRVVTVDADRDGWMDVAFISEGTTIHDRGPAAAAPPLQLYLNRDKGTRWEMVAVAKPTDRGVVSDYLEPANFNGDRMVDFVSGSNAFDATQVLYLSTGKNQWVVGGRAPFPALSYYLGVAVGKFTSKKTDDAMMGFVRIWMKRRAPTGMAPPDQTYVSGLELVSAPRNDRFSRKVIATWEGRHPPTAMGSGDFDGDGKLDVAYVVNLVDQKRELFVLLGDGKGGFSRAAVEGAPLPDNRTYGMTVGDVDRDGRPDIMLMFENSERNTTKRDGSVRVFLNRTPLARSR